MGGRPVLQFLPSPSIYSHEQCAQSLPVLQNSTPERHGARVESDHFSTLFTNARNHVNCDHAYW